MSGISRPVPTAPVISDQVWDEAAAGHVAAGSTGKVLNDAATATALAVVDGLHDLPGVDSADNVVIRDGIGNKSDTHDGNSILAFAHRVDEHFHTAQEVIPDLAAGVTVTSGNPAFVLGAFTEIVAANAIGDDFDLHFVTMEMNNNADYFLKLYAVETLIATVHSIRNANITAINQVQLMTTIIPANTQIQAKLASSAGTASAGIHLWFHRY